MEKWSIAQCVNIDSIEVGSNVLITGGTGLIGRSLVKSISAMEKDIHILCPVRSLDKVQKIFKDGVTDVDFVECELVSFLKDDLPRIKNIHYIIHCASPTNGKYICEHPVETYELAINTTQALLKYARMIGIKGMVYVSSLEYYGQVLDDRLLDESKMGYIDESSSRSSYPLGKHAAEYLCVAYAKEYNVPVKIARLTQTFGPGISFEDNRVFAQFIKSVLRNEDIILHTLGESAKPYCDTYDCVSAILLILFKGEPGEAYNVANEDTYITIRDMADFVQRNFNPSCSVVVCENDNMGYAPITKLRLDTQKLRNLGWKPKYNLYDMYERVIDRMRHIDYQ